MSKHTAQHSGLAAADIQTNTQFGWWVVTDPEVQRLNTVENDDPARLPRYAWVKCLCTACWSTEKLVRVTYLLNGRSTSCCLRGMANKPVPQYKCTG